MRNVGLGREAEGVTSIGGWRELKAALNVEPPARTTVFVTAFLGALTVTFAVIGALALRDLVNTGIYAGFPEAIGALSLAAFGPTLAVATGWLLVARAERVAYRASTRLVERTFAHIQHVRMDVLDDMRSGELTARVIDDPTELAASARWSAGTGLFAMAFGLATVVTAAIVNWRLLGLVVIVTPLFFVVDASLRLWPSSAGVVRAAGDPVRSGRLCSGAPQRCPPGASESRGRPRDRAVGSNG